MKRTFQKWLLIFVVIAFVVAFFVFAAVLLTQAKSSICNTMKTAISSTDDTVETNYKNLDEVYEDSKTYGIETVQCVRAIVERDASGSAPYTMNRKDAVDFNTLYNEVFLYPDDIDYDDDGIITYPFVAGENPFKDDSSRSKEQKKNAFDSYFVNVKSIMEALYSIRTDTTSASINLIDPGKVIDPQTDIDNPAAGGYIVGTTICGYFGYDMYNRLLTPEDPSYNTQSVEFMNYLYASDTGDYAQDITADSSGDYWQYAGCLTRTSDARVGVYQVGTRPYDILDKMERLSFSNIMRSVSFGNGGIMITAVLEDWWNGFTYVKKHIITGITNIESGKSEWIDQRLESYGIPETYVNGSTYRDNFTVFDLNGQKCYVDFTRGANPLTEDPSDDYVLVAVIPEMTVYSPALISLLILSIGMLFLFVIIFVLVSVLLEKSVIRGIYSVNTSLEKITAGDLEEKVTVQTNKELRELSYGINLMVRSLKRSIDREKNRFTKDLEMATTIQTSSLPLLFPPYPERKELDIYATMRPAKEVGGDFYDFFFIDGVHLIFLVADVSGKGIPAALFMMKAKTTIKNLAETRSLSPEEIFTKTNKALCDNNDAEMFVTAFMCMVNVLTGELIYVNAGHNAPLIKHDGKFSYLKSKPGFVLGGLNNYRYHQETMKLSKGDVFYLYTDGVTEATNKEVELYGDDRLLNTLNEKATKLDVTSIVQVITKDVDDFVGEAEQADDITQVAFVYFGEEGPEEKIYKIDATIDNLSLINNSIMDAIKEYKPSKKVIDDILLATEEIYVNVCNYAYSPDIGEVEIRIRMDEPTRTLRIIFRDHGVPFNPLIKQDPDISKDVGEREIGGLGIFLVKRIMDSVAYEYLDGANSLMIAKKI